MSTIDQIENDKRKNKPVCTFCKRRKIKCDRGDPCSSCVRFDNKNCFYLSPEPRINKKRAPKSSKQNLEHELEVLKSKLATLENTVQPNNLSTDKISFKNPTNLDFLPLDAADKVRVGNPSNLFNQEFVDNIRNNLNDIQKVHFDNDFNQLMALVGDDAEFSLFDCDPPIADHGPVSRRNFGILAWKASFDRDPCLKLILKYIKRSPKRDHLFKVKNANDKFNYTKFRSTLNSNAEPIKEEKDSDIDADMDSGFRCDFTNTIPVKIDQPVSEVNHPLPGMNSQKLGLRFGDARNEKLTLLSTIENNLPNETIIWNHIDKFFDKFYGYLPILDEIEFKTQISRLIDRKIPEDSDYSILSKEKIKLSLNNKTDFTYLGILLIILRLGYLSLIPTINANANYFDQLSEIDKMLYENTIDMDIVFISHNCLNQFNLFGSVNIPILQLAMVIRFYQIYAPENGDGPDHGDAQVLNSTLFQMAYSLGLNRDPSRVESMKNEKFNNLSRKIWYCLLLLDLNHSLEYGDPLNANKFTFDTKLPYYTDENSNLVNSNREMFIIDCFQILKVLYEPVTQFVNEIIDVNGTINSVQFCKKIHYLKYKVFSLNSVLNNKNTSFVANIVSKNIKHIYKTKIELQFGHFICSLFFSLFNHFEARKQYDLAFYYLHRFLEKILLIMFPVYLELFSLQGLESSIDFVLIPGIETMLHKGLMFIESLLIRIKITVINYCSDPNHPTLMANDENYSKRFKNFSKLFLYLDEVASNFISIAHAFSKKYYYGWLIARMNQVFIDTLKSKTFRTNIYVEKMEFPLLDDNFKVQQLVGILEQCLIKKKKFESELKDLDNDFHAEVVEDDMMKVDDQNVYGSDTAYSSSSNTNSDPSTDNGNSRFQFSHADLEPSKLDNQSENKEPYWFDNPPIDVATDLDQNFMFTTPDSDIFETTSSTKSRSNNISSVSDVSNNVDTLWLNLLSRKGKQDDLTELNDAGFNTGNANVEQYDMQDKDFNGGSGLTPLFNIGTPNFNNLDVEQVADIRTPNGFKDNDFVTSFVMDELFKDINK
ncbi:hypothetical protein CLIB1444_01S13586 [[Candida] jaroonii]|uniref:Uncharacterized protein n=1 Tax=[Candida] jaroonii TaxID=467808 RepID=A0ACA9Y1D9_9ASCO|nr:hypothetical protein CLIB1444_01S13586 [[Candida] jaroonii]